MEVRAFRKLVLDFYKKEGRNSLPWRKTTNKYRILVSEIMLQQTQVERVKAYYRAWMEKFPTVSDLAKAPLSDVLRAWQGLGYNRRAKMLHDAAKQIVEKHRGKVPSTVEELDALPGVGPYTARAVLAFSENKDVVFIETNLRTAVTHHFFQDKTGIADAEILTILEKALPTGKSREWYSALMDYGSYLKRSGVKINAKSKSYTKQSEFKGSDRQARGAILKELAKGSQSMKRLCGLLGDNRTAQMKVQIQKLLLEGLIERKGAKYQLPQ